MECQGHSHQLVMMTYFSLAILRGQLILVQIRFKAKTILVVPLESIISLAIIMVLLPKVGQPLSNRLGLHPYQLVQFQTPLLNNHTLRILHSHILLNLTLHILLDLILYLRHHQLEQCLWHLLLIQCRWHLLLHLYLLHRQLKIKFFPNH